jgi:WD40 repeat protein
MSHGDWLYAVAFSPDSRLVASTAQSADLKLWDVATEQLLAERRLPQRSQELAFSPSGGLLALNGNGIVRLFAVPSLEETTNFPGNHALFSPDGAKVIYVSKDGSGIHWRDLKTHEEVVWKSAESLSANCMALSRDGRKIALAGGAALKVRLWNADSPNRLLDLGMHADKMQTLAFSPDGHWLASVSWDGTNRLWNLANPSEPAKSLAAHNSGVWAAAFSPDGRTLASGGEDYIIRLWHLESFQQAGVLRGHFGTVTALAFSPDGNHLASGSGDGTVRFWHAPTFEEIAQHERKLK